jgi:hypothetical protein
MTDMVGRDPTSYEPGQLPPIDTALLAAPPQAAIPALDKLAAECVDRFRVGWNTVIVGIATEHLSRPAPVDRDRLVSMPTHGVTDRPELAPHAFAGAMTHQQEVFPRAVGRMEFSTILLSIWIRPSSR